MAKAKDLKAFLASSELREEYFQVLQQYYGKDRFSRESYDAILNQLKEVSRKVPRLAERLWRTEGLGTSFSIKNKLKSHGRELNESEWIKYKSEWRLKLQVEAKGLVNGMPDVAHEYDKVLRTLGALNRQIDEFESRIANQGLGDQEKAAELKKFYRELRSQPEVKQVAAFLLDQHIGYQGIGRLDSSDPDVILSTVEELKANPKLIGQDAYAVATGTRVPGVVIQEAREMIPSVKDVTKNEAAFPRIVVTTRDGARVVGAAAAAPYDFRPMPRGIHGIWEGISLNDCIGGQCEGVRMGMLTPERWGAIALDGAQRVHVEKHGQYMGYIQLVPIKKGKETFVSMELHAPILRQKMHVEGIEGETLYDAWLERVQEHLPAGAQGIVLGQSEGSNNLRVLDTARAAVSYKEGSNLGSAKEFTHFDPQTADAIVAVSPDGIGRARYGGRMSFDAFMPDAGNLVLLNTKNKPAPPVLAVTELEADVEAGSVSPEAVPCKKGFIKRSLERLGF